MRKLHAAKRLGRRNAERVLDGGGAHPALEALLRDAARLPGGPLPREHTTLVQFRSRRLVEGWTPTPTPVRTPSRFRRPKLGVATVVAAGIATTVAIGAVTLVSGTDRVPGLPGLPGLSGRQEPAGALADHPTTTASPTTGTPSTTLSSTAPPAQTPHRSISPSQLVELVQPCTTFLVALQDARATARATSVGPTTSYRSGDSTNGGSSGGDRNVDGHHRWDGHHRHHSPVHQPASPAAPTPQAPPVLVEAAGGADNVPGFCAALVTNSPSRPATTTPPPTTPSTAPSSTPGGSSTSPHSTQTGYG
jgi:hypothetical protein